MFKKENSTKIISRQTTELESFVRFGKEIKISPKTNAMIVKPVSTSTYFVPTVQVLIGIGKNHTAHLVMPKDAWEALLKGEKVVVETTEQHKNKWERKVVVRKGNVSKYKKNGLIIHRR